MTAVVIRSLGPFVVQRGDEVVSAREWRSRKARDLLKLLLCMRGRPATRDALMEALWPEQDPARTGNRLSVALSTVRAVLDPAHRRGADHYVYADRYTVRLARGSLDVDVEAFLVNAGAALALYRAGRCEEAAPALEAAAASYTGDFLEEDLYQDWAVTLREEARAAYVAVASALAELAEGDCDHAAAVRYRLCVLDRDGYDEGAHLGLVATLAAAGRHGAARDAHRRYAVRMAEIGVETVPYKAGVRRDLKATVRSRAHALDDRAREGAWRP